MSKPWTDEQRLAINTRDRTLLVSAAAGSGKTATLTERTIRSLLDEEQPLNIEDLLIVTFTNAAVSELKERIGDAIKQAIKDNPTDARLQRQLLMLPGAKICTIDAYCAEILRSNCDRVGVTPGFRIADGSEAEIVAEGILEGLLDAVYEGLCPEVATPEELENLSECLTETRSQGDLALNLRLIYKETECAEQGIEIIGRLIEEYNPDKYTNPESTSLGAHGIKKIKSFARHYSDILEDAHGSVLLVGDAKLSKVLTVLEDDLAFLRAVLGCDSYGKMRELFFSHEHLKSQQLGSHAAFLPPITAIRTDMKKELAEIKDKILLMTEEDFKKTYEGLYLTLGALYRLLLRFDKLFSEEKGRLGICQYSDVERYAYKCLWDGDEPSDIAIAERARYKAVYIDEYQDVNSLQNKIFVAVSRPDNRFMVGDIKQSIYRFRSANPDIFANMKKKLPLLGGEGDYPAASIFMSKNFRCDRGIIDYVNRVFDRLFGLTAESIGYEDADRLGFGKYAPDKEPPYRHPELCIIEKSLGAHAVKAANIPGIEKPTPLLVAEKIKELLREGRLNDGKKITPGDIAIIMRNASGRDSQYALALENLGIPSVTAEEKTFFMNSEILLALCLLNSIDNPRRDIYLAGLMCSPLAFCGFTPDELALIKAKGKGESLYESLVRYTKEKEGYTRGEFFLKTLEEYRLYAEGVSVDVLLARLYRETGLLNLGAGAGGKEHLLLFYENARRFEKSSYRGLYNFINYINGILDRKHDFDKRSAPTDAKAVKIITAHSSKGLEFPVVFFVESEQEIHKSHEARSRLAYDESFGIGLMLRTPGGLGLVESPVRNLILDYGKSRRVEEEMRVLYVALTRARERLYIIGEAGKKQEEFIADAKRRSEYLDGYSVYGVGSYLDMILRALGSEHKEVGDFLAEPSEFFRMDGELTEEDVAEAEETTEQEPLLEEVSKEYQRRFEFEYPYMHLTRLPEKMSVSRLYPEILDGTEGTGEIDPEHIFAEQAPLDARLKSAKRGILPAFAGGKNQRLSADKGIATHLLLQFCDLEKLYTGGAKAELDRLLAENFISEKDYKLVRVDEAELFRNSELLLAMRAAKSLYRELRFNVRLPAEMFATEENAKELYRGREILVQGVIDCLIEDENGEYRLIDYKTDRLTKEERQDPSLAEQKLRAAHSRQLGYYAEAVKRMFGKAPTRVEVYSLPLGKTLSVG